MSLLTTPEKKDEFLEFLAKQVGRKTKRGQSKPKTKA